MFSPLVLIVGALLCTVIELFLLARGQSSHAFGAAATVLLTLFAADWAMPRTRVTLHETDR